MYEFLLSSRSGRKTENYVEVLIKEIEEFLRIRLYGQIASYSLFRIKDVTESMIQHISRN